MVLDYFYTTAQQIQDQDFAFQMTKSLHFTANRGPMPTGMLRVAGRCIENIKLFKV